jgi:hypothetical protein
VAADSTAAVADCCARLLVFACSTVTTPCVRPVSLGWCCCCMVAVLHATVAALGHGRSAVVCVARQSWGIPPPEVLLCCMCCAAFMAESVVACRKPYSCTIWRQQKHAALYPMLCPAIMYPRVQHPNQTWHGVAHVARALAAVRACMGNSILPQQLCFSKPACCAPRACLPSLSPALQRVAAHVYYLVALGCVSRWCSPVEPLARPPLCGVQCTINNNASMSFVACSMLHAHCCMPVACAMPLLHANCGMCAACQAACMALLLPTFPGLQSRGPAAAAKGVGLSVSAAALCLRRASTSSICVMLDILARLRQRAGADRRCEVLCGAFGPACLCVCNFVCA